MRSPIALASIVVALLGPSDAKVVVAGPGDLALRLLTAKFAAKSGEAAVYAGEEQKGLGQRYRRLMYGKDFDGESDAPGNARVLLDINEFASTLASTEALLLVCDAAPLANDALLALLNNSPECKRVVLVSKMGATRASKPGFMGLGGDDWAVLQGEETVRTEAAARGMSVSVVRVGTLKGGGPGGGTATGNDDGTRSDEEALGLTKSFYDSILELDVYLATSSHDKFTLGAKLSAGDPFDMPNPLVRAARKSSFEPNDEETNRIVAATAVVKAAALERAVDFSVSSVKADALPTDDDWEEMLAQI